MKGDEKGPKVKGPYLRKRDSAVVQTCPADLATFGAGRTAGRTVGQTAGLTTWWAFGWAVERVRWDGQGGGTDSGTDNLVGFRVGGGQIGIATGGGTSVETDVWWDMRRDGSGTCVGHKVVRTGHLKMHRTKVFLNTAAAATLELLLKCGFGCPTQAGTSNTGGRPDFRQICCAQVLGNGAKECFETLKGSRNETTNMELNSKHTIQL